MVRRCEPGDQSAGDRGDRHRESVLCANRFDREDDEQRRQGEVEADDRVRNPLSCRRAQDRATDPVAVQVQLGVDDDASGECLGIGSYRHRIGLVGQREHAVEAGEGVANLFQRKTQGVEHMSKVDQQCGQSDVRQRCHGRDHSDREKLQRSCVDQRGESDCPPRAEPLLDHKNAKCDPKWEQAESNR